MNSRKKVYRTGRINMQLIELAGGSFRRENMVKHKYYGNIYAGILRLNSRESKILVCEYRFGGSELLGIFPEENTEKPDEIADIMSYMSVFLEENRSRIQDNQGIRRNIYVVILMLAKLLAIVFAGIVCKRFLTGNISGQMCIVYLLGCIGLYILSKINEIFLPAMMDVYIEHN